MARHCRDKGDQAAAGCTFNRVQPVGVPGPPVSPRPPAKGGGAACFAGPPLGMVTRKTGGGNPRRNGGASAHKAQAPAFDSFPRPALCFEHNGVRRACLSLPRWSLIRMLASTGVGHEGGRGGRRRLSHSSKTPALRSARRTEYIWLILPESYACSKD